MVGTPPLLAAENRQDFESPLGCPLGCPREHLGFALWYLRGKGYVTRGDNGRFTLTVPGSDEVENAGSSWDHRNQKLLEPGSAGD